jgi:hypothetical protein
MLFKSAWNVLRACSLLALWSVSDGCAAAPADVAALRQSLDDACADAPASVAGDVLAILSSIDPLDAAEPQTYEPGACGGVVFEFDNPEEEPLHGAWVQASGASRAELDALSKSRCSQRVLQADYWGFKDKEWTKLAAADEAARSITDSAMGADYCQLDALMLHEGTFEKLRVVARVTQDSQTYPMHACVW